MSPQLEQDIVSIPIELMKLEARHLPGALKLSQEMGWPYRLEDWEFAATVGSGLVLERAGQVLVPPCRGFTARPMPRSG